VNPDLDPIIEYTLSKMLLLSFGLVVGREFVEELAVDFHERLEYVVDQRHNRLVPVLLGDPIKSRKHDCQDNGRVLFYQAHNVLVVPVIQSPLSHLQHHMQMLVVCRCHDS